MQTGRAGQGGRNFFLAKLSRVGSRYLLNAVAINKQQPVEKKSNTLVHFFRA
jgi:hypothetical protein